MNSHPADQDDQRNLDDTTREYIQMVSRMLADILGDWLERQMQVTPGPQRSNE